MRGAKLTKHLTHEGEKLAIVTRCRNSRAVAPAHAGCVDAIEIRRIEIALDMGPDRVKDFERRFGNVGAVAQTTHLTVEKKALD
jgi:hypothetical protein